MGGFRQITIKLVKVVVFGLFFFALGVSSAVLEIAYRNAIGFKYKPTTISPAPLTQLMVLLGLMILAYFLTLLIHELGHVVGGAVAGSRFVLLVLGPLQITRRHRRLRFGYSGKLTVSGFTVSIPIVDHHLKHRFGLTVAGGPFATLMTVAVVAILFFVFRDGGLIFLLMRAFGFLALFSIMFFFSAIWPKRILGLATDGTWLLTLFKGGSKAEQIAMMIALDSTSISGQRPRALNPEWLRPALAVSDGSMDEAYLNLIAYFHALDNDASDQASVLLDRALSLRPVISPFLQSMYFLEAAYFEARYGQQATLARTWLEQATGGLLVEEHTRLRAEAAILLTENRYQEAQDRASQGLALIEHAINKGRAEAEAEWLKEIVALSQKGQGLSP